MQLQKTVIQNAALVKKPSEKQVIAKSNVPASKKELLIRNLTFETESFLYVINNQKEANLTISSLQKIQLESEAFELDKAKTQNLIEDLNELVTYL